MSIATQLNRLINNITGLTASIADIKSAIEDKDVVVGDAKLNSFAGLISQINYGVIDYAPNVYNLTEQLIKNKRAGYYSCIVKLPKVATSINLTGCSAYYVSDGIFYQSDQTHTWTDWNSTTIDRFIVLYYSSQTVAITVPVGSIELLLGDVIVSSLITSSAMRVIRYSSSTVFNVVDSNTTLNASLRSLSLPVLTVTKSSLLESIGYSLQTVNFPNITSINASWVFNTCTIMEVVIFNEITSITGSYNFYNNGSMKVFIAPKLTVITGISNFAYCAGLKRMQLGMLTAFSASTLQDCTALELLKIGANTNINLDFHYASALSRENVMMYIVPNLKDNTGNTAKTITFATAVYNTLTPEDLALISDKNWGISYA
jgi:hypothetical protein